jgi:hypothetical protein
MKQLKAFRIFFSLAALLFIAKPFLGFGAFYGQSHPRIEHSVLVKSFTKRMPESLAEADADAKQIHQLLADPLTILFPTISCLLLTLFPAVFKNGLKITGKVLSDIHYTLLPPQHSYLLTGKLLI